MTALERRGLRNLTAARPAPPKSATCVVRIYYRSEGGEILCCDSDRLTCARASALMDEMLRSCCDAIHAEIRPANGFGRSPTGRPEGSRFVYLPHQLEAQP